MSNELSFIIVIYVVVVDFCRRRDAVHRRQRHAEWKLTCGDSKPRDTKHLSHYLQSFS